MTLCEEVTLTRDSGLSGFLSLLYPLPLPSEERFGMEWLIQYCEVWFLGFLF